MKYKKTNKQFTQGEKAKRGWWASVVFMLLIVALIIFLTYVKIQEENRDILIGIIGMLTGSISSMLSIACVFLFLAPLGLPEFPDENVPSVFRPFFIK